MKIRNGFVSNSSSSSFIIGLNNEKDDKKLIKRLLDYFKVPTESPLFELVKDIVEFFVIDSEGIDEDENWRTCESEKYKHDYWYYGRVSNGYGTIEGLVMDYITIKIDERDLYFFFDGLF